VVRPGDRIPLDGLVIEGNSVVNQANITGESMPVTKNVGEEVYAGTINQEEYLEVKVNKKPDETLLSKITELVKQSQRRKSKTEAFIEKFATIYTPYGNFTGSNGDHHPSLIIWMVFRGLVL
jgi:Zn2+/Cd2+-exporting ATPase